MSCVKFRKCHSHKYSKTAREEIISLLCSHPYYIFVKTVANNNSSVLILGESKQVSPMRVCKIMSIWIWQDTVSILEIELESFGTHVALSGWPERGQTLAAEGPFAVLTTITVT